MQARMQNQISVVRNINQHRNLRLALSQAPGDEWRWPEINLQVHSIPKSLAAKFDLIAVIKIRYFHEYRTGSMPSNMFEVHNTNTLGRRRRASRDVSTEFTTLHK